MNDRNQESVYQSEALSDVLRQRERLSKAIEKSGLTLFQLDSLMGRLRTIEFVAMLTTMFAMIFLVLGRGTELSLPLLRTLGLVALIVFGYTAYRRQPLRQTRWFLEMQIDQGKNLIQKIDRDLGIPSVSSESSDQPILHGLRMPRRPPSADLPSAKGGGLPNG